MHRARRALTRRWAVWTVALTLGAALAVVQERGAGAPPHVALRPAGAQAVPITAWSGSRP